MKLQEVIKKLKADEKNEKENLKLCMDRLM